MNRNLDWQHRAACARAVMSQSFTHGMGKMDRVEPCLAQALQDILHHPGSLVRAVASYQVGLEMGLGEKAARSIGCGIEYLHTASLIFDDFPAMDNAHMRRGSFCPHVIHGEATATLAALALINRGYVLLWQGIQYGSLRRRLPAGKWIDARLGARGVIGGQAWDLQGWQDGQTAAEVSQVAARKTADLLRLAIVLPAIAGNGSEREIQLLDRLALLRGLAYQAADDLKDVLSHEGQTGKTGSRDAALGRPNLVAAEGVESASQRFRRLVLAGDRVQKAMPGPDGRWQLLDILRVPLFPVMPQEQRFYAVI